MVMYVTRVVMFFYMICTVANFAVSCRNMRFLLLHILLAQRYRLVTMQLFLVFFIEFSSVHDAH